MPTWVNQLGFVIACLAIPIVWGWLVNVLFVRISRHRRERTEMEARDDSRDRPFSDYQI